MNLETFYQKTIPVFGLSTESADGSLVLHIGEDTVPLKIKEKLVYLPTKTVIDKGISDEYMVYHPAQEDVTKPLTLAMEATVKVTSLYYSFTLLTVLGGIVETISAEENTEELDPKVKSLLMDVYKFPPLTKSDAQHIGNCLQAISVLDDINFIVDVNVRKTKPTQEGLRVATVTSRFLEAVDMAVRDDATVVAGVTMSKRSIKALQQIASALLPNQMFVPVVNEHTACPAYEVVWTMAARFADVVNAFRMFVDEPAVRLDAVANSVNSHVLGTVSPKKLSGTIATVIATEGNKPLAKVKRNIDLNVGSAQQAAPPVQQHQPQQMTQIQQPQYQTPPPQQQAAKVDSNSEFAALPAWLQTPQYPMQGAPQGYMVANGQQAYPVQAVPQGYIVQQAPPQVVYPQGQQVMYSQQNTQYPMQGAPQGYIMANGQQAYPMQVGPQGQQVMYSQPAPPQQYYPYTPAGYVGTR
jgi:hypothetical protein